MNFSNTETAQSYIHCCSPVVEETQEIYKMHVYY